MIIIIIMININNTNIIMRGMETYSCVKFLLPYSALILRIVKILNFAEKFSWLSNNVTFY